MPKPLRNPEDYRDDELVSIHYQTLGLNVKLISRIANKRGLHRNDFITKLLRSGLLAQGYKDEAAQWVDNPPVGHKGDD